MLFNWIRARVKAAVLGGLNDAVDLLTSGEDATHEGAEEALVLRLRLVAPPAALPAGEEEAPARKKRG